MLLVEKVYVQVHAIQFILTEAEICRVVGLEPPVLQNLLFCPEL